MLHCVSIRSRRVIRLGGIVGNGLHKMTILSALSERLSVRRASDLPQAPGDVPAGSAGDAELPLPAMTAWTTAR